MNIGQLQMAAELLDGKNDYRDYGEWIVECDGHLLSWYERDSDFNYSYRNALS